MKDKSETNQNTSTQRDRFIEAARAIDADEDMDAFRAKLGVIARQKPTADVPQPPDQP